MLNADTKRRIDSARQILVGVVPDPKGQIDQITNALIYKFMDDMDRASVRLGGKASFFEGELKPYAWTRLMDPKLGNQERLNLYAEALAKFSTAKALPELFRDIFRLAVLPHRNPEVLGLFLKELNGFTYDHSEDLGDAFEYLLSVMGSQGDAGQFRTPRHIIDFIVAVVAPTKDETVLDPACGTAGFLVSAFKFIQKRHVGGRDADGTIREAGKQLTPAERIKLMGNFTGYDISPDMVRLSRVNMYLHGFPQPNIIAYDTLSSDARWDDKFDVILANPPFMSPKGGIIPHHRFQLQSSRAEVLFVDYIMTHLRPHGRAGVIVPEGIVFQSGKAHKDLRKLLVEDGLYAVVSLPAGVFNPYSGVKTSILLFDRDVAKRSADVLFVKVEADGYDLGAQRRPTAKNDLPEALKILREHRNVVLGEDTSSSGLSRGSIQHLLVPKSRIAADGDYNLTGDRYRDTTRPTSTKWPMVKLGDESLFKIESGSTPKSENPSYWGGNIRWVTLADLPASERISEISTTHRTITDEGLSNSSAKLLPVGTVLVSSRATIGRIAIARAPLATNQGFKNIVIKDESRALTSFVAHMMTALIPKMQSLATGGTFKEVSMKTFKTLEIPLPPLEVQKELAAELDGYQNKIDQHNREIQKLKQQTIDKTGTLFN